MVGFSKVYDQPPSPKEGFCAIMTCSAADERCPVVFGASERIAIRYDDPKEHGGTALEEQRYDERCRQTAREMLYELVAQRSAASFGFREGPFSLHFRPVL